MFKSHLTLPTYILGKVGDGHIAIVCVKARNSWEIDLVPESV